jgi:hypothetical protein
MRPSNKELSEKHESLLLGKGKVTRLVENKKSSYISQYSTSKVNKIFRWLNQNGRDTTQGSSGTKEMSLDIRASS